RLAELGLAQDDRGLERCRNKVLAQKMPPQDDAVVNGGTFGHTISFRQRRSCSRQGAITKLNGLYLVRGLRADGGLRIFFHRPTNFQHGGGTSPSRSPHQ